jgi:uncharacterized membrane protein YgaE (UPF0421/DUF939 family)
VTTVGITVGVTVGVTVGITVSLLIIDLTLRISEYYSNSITIDKIAI